jgi:poly(3-hydroxybutyrate) depolymerase
VWLWPARLRSANRRYAVHIPSSYDFESPQPLPLLLYVHGQGGTAKGDIPPYVAIGEREGFITVSGQGLGAGEAPPRTPATLSVA